MRKILGLVLSFGVAVAFISPSYASSSPYEEIIRYHAHLNGVPVDLARAVIRHESGFRAHVTGAAGEIGLMQIKLSTARGMGYKGSRKALYDPKINIAWGMKYLGKARKLAGGSQCGTLSRYNGGLANKRLIKSYCRSVVNKMA